VPPTPDPFSAIPPDVLTTEQTADRLGFNEVTIRKWINDGTLPARLLGREWRLWWPSVVIALFYNGENDDHADGPAPPPKTPTNGE
jgi:excisionase family DNA binding protein